MDNLKISDATLRKLRKKHQVSRREVEQCFENRVGRLLEDTRVTHKTTPPSLWFLAKTNPGRLLEVVYIQIDATVELKSAFEPIQVERDIYARAGGVQY